MDTVDTDTVIDALALFSEGRSIRAVSRELGIARETAHRLQKFQRLLDIRLEGYCRVKLNGTSSVTVRDIEPRWYYQQYISSEKDLDDMVGEIL